jgi:hypothetical protein
LPEIPVAGKTGTLEKKDQAGGTLYTWWVGFAPARKPEVAIAVLIANRGSWKIKGTHVAADMLRIYFADQGRAGVHYPPNFDGPKRGPTEKPKDGAKPEEAKPENKNELSDPDVNEARAEEAAEAKSS